VTSSTYLELKKINAVKCVAQFILQTVNYKDTHRNKSENYFLGLLAIMGVLLIDSY
jgi:hypothetical protein